MNSVPLSEQPVPKIRQDLQIFRAPDEADGSPTYSVYDPVRAKYFKISWAEAAILQNIRPRMTIGELIIALDKNSTLRVTAEELGAFFVDADRQGLLERHHQADSLLGEAEKSKMHPIKSFLLYYLFFRIPLINPDAFLARTLDKVSIFLTKPALIIYLLICGWGLAVIAVQWDAFFNTFTYFFNVSGLIAYACAIAGTKIVHEFAHAYTAKKYGLHVPTMGIALLVLFPVLYTDVTDGWRLASQKKRMAISAAGVLAESTIAGMASILWAFSEPGILQSVFFILASANWISTLVINLNPALRFDGYYLFMDWLGVENLQPRAFHLTRCAAYSTFLGIHLANPEPRLSHATRRTLILYTIYTFIYRLFLYTAIALFVYFKFTKTLGIFLFAVEILLFFIWPVVYEASLLRRVLPLARLNERTFMTLGALSLITLWLIIPLPHTLSFVATTLAVDDRVIYVPSNGQVRKIAVKRGDLVAKGDLLVSLESIDLVDHLGALRAQSESSKKKMEIASDDEKLRSYYQEKMAEMARIDAEAEGVARQIQQLQIVSDVSGIVYDWDNDLRIGQFVGKDMILGRLASAKALDAVCFVPENDISYITIGQQVTFRPKGFGNSVHGAVERISPIRAAALEYPQLASVNGGALAVTEEKKGDYRLLESYFPVVVSLEERGDLKIGEEGTIKVRGPWNSYLMRLVRFVTAVLWQEGNA